MRTTVQFIISSAVIFAILAVGAGIFLAEGALHPGRRRLSAADHSRGLQIAAQGNAAFDEVEIAAADGIRLRGWNMRSLQNNGDAVILFHGLSDNRIGTIGCAELFLKHGYSVLMPDARAHGESEGELPPTACLKRKTFNAGAPGLKVTNIRTASLVLLNRWAPPACCNPSNQRRTFVQSSPNRLSLISER